MMPRLLVIPAIILAACGCARTDVAPLAAQPPAEPSSPVKVTLVKPELRKIKRVVEEPGSVRADLESPLTAKITGFVQSVAVEIGDRVKAGDSLVVISVPELDEEAKLKDAEVRQADVAIQLARKHLLTAEAQVGVAEAAIEEAQAGKKKAEAYYERWASEEKRMTDLALKKQIGEQERDEAINQAKGADAARDEVQAKVRSAQAALKKYKSEQDFAEVDIEAKKVKLEVAKADAARVKALLQYKTIKAPFDGVVTRRLVDPGYFVKEGKPETLLVVASVEKVRVSVDVQERDVSLVKIGDTVKVRFPALDGKTVTGTVARSSWSLDPQARWLRAEIDLPNLDGTLHPSLYAVILISVETSDVRTVPAKALFKAGETMALFVVKDNKAARIRVKAGRSDGEFTEVAQQQKADGTWEAFTGDVEVVANVAAVTDGQAVEAAAHGR